MIRTLYNFLITSASGLLPLVPSQKVQQYSKLQQENWTRLNQFTFQSPIWFHIASSGEFEQARPVIEQLRSTSQQIIVTFFSPSGFEAQKHNDLLDGVFYLPIDTNANVKRFLQLVQPKICILTKYDFWLNYLIELHARNIPICLLSALLTQYHFLFQWYGKKHLEQVKQFAYISTQNQATKELLENYSIASEFTGDTRIDRSLQLPKTPYNNEIIEQFTSNHTSILLGSAWEKDIELFQEHLRIITKRNGRLIIAPHQLNEEFLQHIERNFSAQRLSNCTAIADLAGDVLLIDQIGTLKYIYRYADIVYIGGGFGKGIHNTLEPAAYAKPIVIGPNHKQFVEANEMIKRGGAFAVHSKAELLECLAFLFIKNNRKEAGENAKNYLVEHSGASEQAAKAINEILNKSDLKFA